MDLFSFHHRYLQVTVRSEKAATLMKAALSERHSCCLLDQLNLPWGELASRGTKELEELQEIQCYKAEGAIEPQINTNIESFLLVFYCCFY